MTTPAAPPSGESSEERRERLDRVRAQLRSRGYLSHRYERYLLQDAWRPRRPLRVALHLAARVGLAGGTAVALAAATALAVVNGSLQESPFDWAVLFLHLLLPAVAVLGVGFLVAAAGVGLVLRISPVRRIEIVSTAAALAAGAVAVAVGLWGLRGLWLEAPAWQLILLTMAVPLAVFAVVKLLESALLGLAIQLTNQVPRRRLFSRRWLTAATLLGLFLLTLPAVLAVRGDAPEPPVNLPTAAGERVVLIGVDGVLAEELEYLLAVGDLPRMAALLEPGAEGPPGAILGRYRRPPGPPAVFWTTVATGRTGTAHGLSSLDSFLPRGTRTPLARTGPSRPYWRHVAVPLGLAEYRPLLSNRRRAFTVWELAARGGIPALAVNWWGTFPAEPLPGLVLAHGAFQLLQETGGESDDLGSRAVGTEAGPPEAGALTEALRKQAASTKPGPFRAPLRAALAPAEVRAAMDLAALPDRFYTEVFETSVFGAPEGSGASGFSTPPRAAALYLPALDLLADRWQGNTAAFADLVRVQLAQVDRLVGRAVRGAEPTSATAVDTVAVIFDPGRRRGPRDGRILLWRRTGCGDADGRGRIRPPEVAAALLRALGLPQSRELPPPPRGCAFAPAPDELPSYGDRPLQPPPGGEGGEYLESLRSLGYL